MNITHHSSIFEAHSTLSQSSKKGVERPVYQRKAALLQLKKAIAVNETRIYEALQQDLKRPRFEAFALELSLVNQEIDDALSSLSDWCKTVKVSTPFQFQPGTSYIKPHPLGLVLIFSPWNYPFQLSLVPLISAIAAGNCAIVKPSEIASHSEKLIVELINSYLDPVCFRAIPGGAEVAQALLDLPFDHIFFTGNGHVGAEVMKKAAHFLTPVTLELGGKSPALIHKSKHLRLAAKRIVWGKFLNAGQTCIAPDYVLIDQADKDEFIELAQEELKVMYGEQVEKSSDYGRIINDRHFTRLTELLKEGRIVHGGAVDKNTRFIEPTIMVDPKAESKILYEEIFGPLLLVLGIESLDDGIQFITERPHPLALYVFSDSKEKIKKIFKRTKSGSFCINDCVSQAGILSLPFGGIGASGMGQYHGKFGFDLFSHRRAVHKRSLIFDNPLRYAPYSESKFSLVKKLL
jgi:aldehyde dehydrogenase (NAD+)